MARLVWDGIREAVAMQADDGEELTPDQVAAWGQVQAARELMNIGHWIEEIKDEMSRSRP